jgi:hypothetical protein
LIRNYSYWIKVLQYSKIKVWKGKILSSAHNCNLKFGRAEYYPQHMSVENLLRPEAKFVVPDWGI